MRFWKWLKKRREKRQRDLELQSAEEQTKNDTTGQEEGVTKNSGAKDTAEIESHLDAAKGQVPSLQEENEQTTKELSPAITTTTTTTDAVTAPLFVEEKGAVEDQVEALEIHNNKLNTVPPPEVVSEGGNTDFQTTKQELVAETATDPAVEAARIYESYDENDNSKKELDRPKSESDEIQKLEEENEKTKTALATALATAEAQETAKLTRINDDLNEQFKNKEIMLQELQSENKNLYMALATATAELESLRQEIAALRGTNEKLSEEFDDSKYMVQTLEVQLEELVDEINKSKAALDAANSFSSSAAALEAVKINKLQQEIDNLQSENSDLKVHLRNQVEQNLERMHLMRQEIEQVKRENETTKKALLAVTDGPGTAVVATKANIQGLQAQVATLLEEKEELLIELEQSRRTEALAAEMIETLQQRNEELRVATVATDHNPTSRSVGAAFQRDEDGSFGIFESSDPPGFNEGDPSSSMTMQEVLAENHILKAELDMVKGEYAQTLSAMKVFEESIRLELAAKIDELQKKNEKRKEALELATAKVSHDNKRMLELRKEKETLQERIHQLKEENAKLAAFHRLNTRDR